MQMTEAKTMEPRDMYVNSSVRLKCPFEGMKLTQKPAGVSFDPRNNFCLVPVKLVS